jgi:homoserine dehydrogenase
VTKPLSVGVAGLGTVGAGVVTLLRANADLIAARAGRHGSAGGPVLRLITRRRWRCVWPRWL